MRRIIVSEYLTLDGVFEDPGGAEKTKFGGWSFEFWNDEAMRYKHDELLAVDALLLGRITYEGFAEAWPAMQDAGDFGARMNSLPKYVVSRTLTQAAWHNSHLINANIVDALHRLKDQGGQDILVAGSGDLAYTLMQTNLIDEYRFLVHPVILGEGKHFFKEGIKKQTGKLIYKKAFKTGIMALHYQPILVSSPTL